MPEVCLVIPCFNEASRLDGRAILALLAARSRELSVCLVDDGSSDGTVERARGAAGASGRHAILVHRLPANRGKAEAVRQGVRHVAAAARPRFRRLLGRGFFDAARRAAAPARRDAGAPGLPDGARLARQAARLADRSAHGPSRAGPRSSRPARTRSSRFLFTTRSAARSCSASRPSTTCSREPFVTRWCFDLEILVRLRNTLGPEPIPSRRDRSAARTVARGRRIQAGPAQMLQIPMSLLRIRRHYRAGRAGRAGGAGVSPGLTARLQRLACLPRAGRLPRLPCPPCQPYTSARIAAAACSVAVDGPTRRAAAARARRPPTRCQRPATRSSCSMNWQRSRRGIAATITSCSTNDPARGIDEGGAVGDALGHDPVARLGHHDVGSGDEVSDSPAPRAGSSVRAKHRSAALSTGRPRLRSR